MPSRSWMAALSVASVLALTPGSSRADDAVTNRVQLNLHIVGLGPAGCEVEVRPAHPGSQFPRVLRRVGSSAETARFTLDARSISADRDCTVAITVREPGLPPRTYRRGVRLTPPLPGQPLPVQSLSFHLTAPSLAAREDRPAIRR